MTVARAYHTGRGVDKFLAAKQLSFILARRPPDQRTHLKDLLSRFHLDDTESIIECLPTASHDQSLVKIPRQIRIATTPEPSHLHTASSNLWRFWKLAAGLSLALLAATALLSLVDPLPVEPHQPQVPYLPDTALNETLRRGEEQTVAPMALRSQRKLHRTEKPTRESDSVLRGIQRIGNALGAHVFCVRTDVPACYLVKATSTAPFSKSLSLRRMKSRRRCRPSKLSSPSLETLGCLTVADRWLREFPHQMHSGDQNR